MAGAAPARPHQLAIYDNGSVRLLLDRSAGQPLRLLARLTRDAALAPGDEAPQVKAICYEYVRQCLRDGGPLACRLTRAHLTGEHRQISRLDAAQIAQEPVPSREPVRTTPPASTSQGAFGRSAAGWDCRPAA